MGDIPVLTSRQIIKGLNKAGFVLVRQKGSHQIYKKDAQLVVVPVHPGDLKRGTTKSIIAHAGLEVEDFLKLL